MKLTTFFIAFTACLLALVGLAACSLRFTPSWSSQEVTTLTSLSLSSLPQLPPDPGNAFADNPRAADLGHKLFFDTRLSANGEVSCASCHQPERNFLDGLPRSRGVGETPRKSMTVVGAAYSPWLFWDGRKDSLWAQALGPLENPVEHAFTRSEVAHLIARHYRPEYEAIFGRLPDLSHLPIRAGPVEDGEARATWEGVSPVDREMVTRIFVNVGKAIAAYERQLLPGPSRFDRYAQAVLQNDRAGQRVLSSDEVAGLRLFIGEAGCTNCHSGPMLTNQDFHNTGVPAVPGLPEDSGRAVGARQVLTDEFNCLSPYSDAEPDDCAELRFLKAEGHTLLRAFKVPSLRNVAQSAPYMHAGQFSNLPQVLSHYNKAPEAPAGHSELEPLGLSDTELGQLEAFLETLCAPLASSPELLAPPKERKGIGMFDAARREHGDDSPGPN